MTESNILEVDISRTGVKDVVLTTGSELLSRDNGNDVPFADDVKIGVLEVGVVSSDISLEFWPNIFESVGRTVAEGVRSSVDWLDFDDDKLSGDAASYEVVSALELPCEDWVTELVKTDTSRVKLLEIEDDIVLIMFWVVVSA